MTEIEARRRGLATLATVGLLALGGAGLTACGDDKEGPGEDVGEAIDKGAKKLGNEAEENAKQAERKLDDGKRD